MQLINLTTYTMLAPSKIDGEIFQVFIKIYLAYFQTSGYRVSICFRSLHLHKNSNSDALEEIK